MDLPCSYNASRITFTTNDLYHHEAPAPDARRVTFMIAFWEENPRAPPMPQSAEAGLEAPGLKWPAILTQSFGAGEDGESQSKRARPNGCAQNLAAVIEINGLVQPLRCDSSSISSGKSKSKSKQAEKEAEAAAAGAVAGVDLLGGEAFTYFEALNSGLILARTCSLNCGGACDACQSYQLRRQAEEEAEEDEDEDDEEDGAEVENEEDDES